MRATCAYLPTKWGRREPEFKADAKVRKELRRWLRRLHDELHIASVFVTHDQEEALEVADRVAILNHGQIEQVGTPLAVYDNPANAFVYKFIGDVNLFHERAAPVRPAAGEGPLGPSTVTYVRPYELDLSRHTAGTSGAVIATVRYIGAAGPVVRLELQREDTGNSLDAEISRERFRELDLRVGDKVDVIARNLRVFADEVGSQGAGI